MFDASDYNNCTLLYIISYTRTFHWINFRQRQHVSWTFALFSARALGVNKSNRFEQLDYRRYNNCAAAAAAFDACDLHYRNYCDIVKSTALIVRIWISNPSNHFPANEICLKSDLCDESPNSDWVSVNSQFTKIIDRPMARRRFYILFYPRTFVLYYYYLLRYYYNISNICILFCDKYTP